MIKEPPKLKLILERIIQGSAYVEEIAYAYVYLEMQLSDECKACGKLFTSGGDCTATCKKEIADNFRLVFNKTNENCVYCGKPFFECDCEYETIEDEKRD
jgi:hypothetical protein